MALRKGQRQGNNGNHGAPGRSGRKPKAITLLKRQLIENGKEDAEYAYSLYVSVMQDEAQPTELRLQCADWIANRVLGKPKERAEISGEVAVKAYVGINPDDWNVDSKPEP